MRIEDGRRGVCAATELLGARYEGWGTCKCVVVVTVGCVVVVDRGALDVTTVLEFVGEA